MMRHGSLSAVPAPLAPIYDLRVAPESFVKIVRGVRSSVVCKSERRFHVGEVVRFRSYLASTETFTGERAYCEVSDVMDGRGLEMGHVLLSLWRLPAQWGADHGDTGDYGVFGVYVGGAFRSAVDVSEVRHEV